jgi:uncharacterized Tic20 family protein
MTDLDRELDEMADRELRGQALPPPQVLAPTASADDRNYAAMTHVATVAAAVFSGGFLDIIVPAIAYVMFKDKGDFLKNHVKHQLNFQLTNLLVLAVALGVSAVTFGVGLLVAIPAIVFFFVTDVVCSIRAALAASRGEGYEFPFAIDFLK